VSSLANTVTIQHVSDVNLNRIKENLEHSYDIQDILFHLAAQHSILIELANKHKNELSEEFKKCVGYINSHNNKQQEYLDRISIRAELNDNNNKADIDIAELN
jgi:hypothetical protein